MQQWVKKITPKETQREGESKLQDKRELVSKGGRHNKSWLRSDGGMVLGVGQRGMDFAQWCFANGKITGRRDIAVLLHPQWWRFRRVGRWGSALGWREEEEEEDWGRVGCRGEEWGVGDHGHGLRGTFLLLKFFILTMIYFKPSCILPSECITPIW